MVKCRNCGAGIADKALICYKCGTATTEAKYKPAQVQARFSSRTLIVTILLLALLALLALYLSSGMR